MKKKIQDTGNVKIILSLDEYSGVFDHTLVTKNTDTRFGLLTEVSKEKLDELDGLKIAKDNYESSISELYEEAEEHLRKAKEKAKCKYRLRPGKLCGHQVIPGTDRCRDHRGAKNISNKFKESVDREVE